MKTTRELLILVKSSKSLFFSGLCGLIERMYFHDIINDDEYARLTQYLNENKPAMTMFNLFYGADRNSVNYGYWWKFGRWSPRERWLNKQIKLLEKQELKKLFEILLQNCEYTYLTGICMLTFFLSEQKRIITFEDGELIREYIRTHRPKWYSRHYCSESKNSAYYWLNCDWVSRKRWIKAQIKKLS